LDKKEETTKDTTKPQKPSLDKTKIPEEIDVVVVNMDNVLYEGKAKSIIAPGTNGNFAVLPGHTPLFTKLEKGTLIIDVGQEKPREFTIDGGVAKINQFKAMVLIGFNEPKPIKK